MSDGHSSSGGWPLLARWTVASAIGWAAGLAAGILLNLAASRLTQLDEDRFFAYATLMTLGLTTGAAQSIVLRHYLRRPVRWIAATVVGYLMCLIIIVGGNLARLGVAGVWDDATWWVPATAIGLLWFVWTVISPAHSAGELLIRGTLIGALTAGVPGVALIWLVRRPRAGGSQRTA
jgi:hypothetical protein